MSEGETVGRKRGYVAGDGLAGGFWRRVLAFWIDHAVVGLALSLIGAVAFPLTDGWVRHSSPVVVLGACAAIDPAASRNVDRLPGPDARAPLAAIRPARAPDVVSVKRCDLSLLGFSTHASVQATRFWRSGYTYRETASFPLRPGGRLIARTLDLGTLFFPVLIVWLSLAEGAWGAGPGKALLGLRVVRGDGVSRPGWGPALRRNLIQYGPMAALGVFVTVAGLLRSTSGGVMFDPVLGWGFLALAVMTGFWGLALVLAVLFQRPDPFWDRWSDVSVRRRVWIEQP